LEDPPHVSAPNPRLEWPHHCAGPKANLDFDVADLMAGILPEALCAGRRAIDRRAVEEASSSSASLQQDDSDLLKMIRDILQSNDKGGGSLDTISVRDARLAFRDEPTGLFIVSPPAISPCRTQRPS